MIDMARNGIRLGSILLLLACHAGHAADDPGDDWSIITHSFDCERALQSVEGWIAMQPTYQRNNPAPGLNQTLMRHQDNGFTTFSPDGRTVLIHHYFSPNAVQISVRRVDDGSPQGTFLWRQGTQALSKVHSAQWLSETAELVALVGGVFESTAAEKTYLWHSRDSVRKVESSAVPPINYQNLQVVPRTTSQSYTMRSEVSANHPYVFQAKYLPYGDDSGRFLARIHNWRTNNVLVLDDVSPLVHEIGRPEDFFHFKFGLLAVPSADAMRINLMSFEDMEAELNNRKPAGEYGRQTSHVKYSARIALTHPVRRMRFVPWGPILVTQTEEGLQIWHAQRHVLMASVPDGLWGDFEILRNMGVIAIALPERKLGLYSIMQRRFVSTLSDFGGLRIAPLIDHWEAGVVYLTNSRGHVYRLRETIGDSPQSTQYELTDTGLEDRSLILARYRTVVRTANDAYFVSFADLHRDEGKGHDLLMRIYSLSSKNFVGEFAFQMRDMTSQYTLDPGRSRLFFTADWETTSLIKLSEFLESRGY